MPQPLPATHRLLTAPCSRRQLLQTLAAAASAGAGLAPLSAAADASREPAECIAPSRPGGGFDLTCGLASQALQAVRPGRTPLRTRYLPGGIGAVAFDQVATGRLGGPGTLVAFSSGSLLNLAQGRFGPHPVSAVRWIATLGNDYGVVAVHRDAPYQRLQDVVTALQKDSGRVVFGATLDLEDLENGTKFTYQIVGDDEADIELNKISISSPIARALIGKEEGDVVAVQAPGGNREVEILAVRYI